MVSLLSHGKAFYSVDYLYSNLFFCPRRETLVSGYTIKRQIWNFSLIAKKINRIWEKRVSLPYRLL